MATPAAAAIAALEAQVVSFKSAMTGLGAVLGAAVVAAVSLYVHRQRVSLVAKNKALETAASGPPVVVDNVAALRPQYAPAAGPAIVDYGAPRPPSAFAGPSYGTAGKV